MECIRWVAWFFEFNFSDQQINSIKLKNLGSLREFVRNVLHIPSLKKEEEDPRRTKVVWSNKRFDHPSLNSICPSL